MHHLVIGATGYLGTRLVPALLARGDTVRALVRDEAAPARRERPAGVEFVPGDAADLTAVRGACAGADTVFHLVRPGAAATSSGSRSRRAGYSAGSTGSRNDPPTTSCSR